MAKPIPKVNLHPASCKYLKLGHPWITDDSYTKKFPKEAFFLIGVDEKNRQDVALLINDPLHKTVKARLWSLDKAEWTLEFKDVLSKRIKIAIDLRRPLMSERENIFLINGESDGLPGLIVQQLKNELMIQYYAMFWKAQEADLLSLLKDNLPEIKDIWIQERNFDQAKAIRSINVAKTSSEFVLKEFGLNYQIKINQHYDFGIYSDMSAIRKNMRPYLQNKTSLLNLFSYTGAFSVFCLGMDFENVVSVDLSPKYLAWLEENIALNPKLIKDNHSSLCMPSEKAMDKLIGERMKFEVIVCDPPSASSDGNKISSALKSYENLLPQMLELLDEEKGQIFAFLNTHTISWTKFEEKLKSIVDSSKFKNKVIIGKRFKLSEDCVPLKGFHEGDYLKGFLIEFK
ncbi:MAG: class I SAM-dependent methyltransferase [Rhizobacter sp.]|nr:class I SAM-dependent methyltransferase [Bacteriovorax sp.]